MTEADYGSCIDFGSCGECVSFSRQRLENSRFEFPEGLFGYCHSHTFRRIFIVHRDATPRQSLMGNGFARKAALMLRAGMTCFYPRTNDRFTDMVEVEMALNDMGESLFRRC